MPSSNTLTVFDAAIRLAIRIPLGERTSQMKQLIATILVLLVFSGIVLGQAASVKKAAEKPVPDICKGPVDPYDMNGEKTRFYAAAGKDNELTAEEFNAAKAKANSFVRKFDSWRILVTFDKDKNSKIDWTEASAYRQETRRKVLAAFDKNKDGSLAGEERTAANKALAAGRISLGSARASREARRAQWRAEMLKKYDKDNDGKLSEAEEAARRKAWEQANRERMERHRRERELREHDADKDGKLNEKETAARDKARAEGEKRRAEWEQRRKDFVKKYDKNGDGRLNGEEWREARPALRAAMEKRMLERYDTNKDGELSEDEQAARRKEWEKRREDMRSRYELRRFDKNKDGKLDGQETGERDKWRKEREAEREKRRADYIKRYDKNGDGQVDDKERPQWGGRGRRRGDRGRGRRREGSGESSNNE